MSSRQTERGPDLRLGLVEYRDHVSRAGTDTPTITRAFTERLDEFLGVLGRVECGGGADHAEAVADGLDAVLGLPWRRRAQKAVVLVADAPPHGVGSPSDNFPKGCPCGRSMDEIGRRLARKGVVVHGVAVTDDPDAAEALQRVAKQTGGQFEKLTSAQRLSAVLVALARDERRKVADDIEIADRFHAVGGEIDRIAESTGLTDDQVRAGIERLRLKDAIVSRNVQGDLNALDLCFLVDATGSMQPWIDRVRSTVTEIVQEVARAPETGGAHARETRVRIRR